MAETINGKPRKARGYFRGRAVAVTGASSGIGYDVALTFGGQGAPVALLARRKPELEALAEKINAAGGRALALECDVTRRPDVEEAIEKAHEAFGKIDILVNAAGRLIPDPVEKIRAEDLEKMLSVNLLGALNATQAVLPLMRERRAGRIINVASLAGRRGITPLGGYSATKFALVGLTEALRTELFGTGVTASLIMPGVIDTPMMAGAASHESLKGIPGAALAMPVRWVTWAVMAAAALGLAEVDVPPGSATAEKLAALFPGATDAFITVGTRLMKSATQLLSRSSMAASGDKAKSPDKSGTQRRTAKHAAA